ncbi:unnamed protein product [Amoebophrya sp. A120]|nr:unnamed protein product [Amoebophrya sp. A120]|eukprot:GSA120T00019765001.1
MLHHAYSRRIACSWVVGLGAAAMTFSITSFFCILLTSAFEQAVDNVIAADINLPSCGHALECDAPPPPPPNATIARPQVQRQFSSTILQPSTSTPGGREENVFNPAARTTKICRISGNDGQRSFFIPTSCAFQFNGTIIFDQAMVEAAWSRVSLRIESVSGSILVKDSFFWRFAKLEFRTTASSGNSTTSSAGAGGGALPVDARSRTTLDKVDEHKLGRAATSYCQPPCSSTSTSSSNEPSPTLPPGSLTFDWQAPSSESQKFLTVEHLIFNTSGARATSTTAGDGRELLMELPSTEDAHALSDSSSVGDILVNGTRKVEFRGISKFEIIGNEKGSIQLLHGLFNVYDEMLVSNTNTAAGKNRDKRTTFLVRGAGREESSLESAQPRPAASTQLQPPSRGRGGRLHSSQKNAAGAVAPTLAPPVITLGPETSLFCSGKIYVDAVAQLSVQVARVASFLNTDVLPGLFLRSLNSVVLLNPSDTWNCDVIAVFSSNEIRFEAKSDYYDTDLRTGGDRFDCDSGGGGSSGQRQTPRRLAHEEEDGPRSDDLQPGDLSRQERDTRYDDDLSRQQDVLLQTHHQQDEQEDEEEAGRSSGTTLRTSTSSKTTVAATGFSSRPFSSSGGGPPRDAIDFCEMWTTPCGKQEVKKTSPKQQQESYGHFSQVVHSQEDHPEDADGGGAEENEQGEAVEAHRGFFRFPAPAGEKGRKTSYMVTGGGEKTSIARRDHDEISETQDEEDNSCYTANWYTSSNNTNDFQQPDLRQLAKDFVSTKLSTASKIPFDFIFVSPKVTVDEKSKIQAQAMLFCSDELQLKKATLSTTGRGCQAGEGIGRGASSRDELLGAGGSHSGRGGYSVIAKSQGIMPVASPGMEYDVPDHDLISQLDEEQITPENSLLPGEDYDEKTKEKTFPSEDAVQQEDLFSRSLKHDDDYEHEQQLHLVQDGQELGLLRRSSSTNSQHSLYNRRTTTLRSNRSSNIWWDVSTPASGGGCGDITQCSFLYRLPNKPSSGGGMIWVNAVKISLFQSVLSTDGNKGMVSEGAFGQGWASGGGSGGQIVIHTLDDIVGSGLLTSRGGNNACLEKGASGAGGGGLVGIRWHNAAPSPGGRARGRAAVGVHAPEVFLDTHLLMQQLHEDIRTRSRERNIQITVSGGTIDPSCLENPPPHVHTVTESIQGKRGVASHLGMCSPGLSGTFCTPCERGKWSNGGASCLVCDTPRNVEKFEWTTSGWPNATCPYRCPINYPSLNTNPQCLDPWRYTMAFFGGLFGLLTIGVVLVLFILISLTCEEHRRKRRRKMLQLAYSMEQALVGSSGSAGDQTTTQLSSSGSDKHHAEGINYEQIIKDGSRQNNNANNRGTTSPNVEEQYSSNFHSLPRIARTNSSNVSVFNGGSGATTSGAGSTSTSFARGLLRKNGRMMTTFGYNRNVDQMGMERLSMAKWAEVKVRPMGFSSTSTSPPGAITGGSAHHNVRRAARGGALFAGGDLRQEEQPPNSLTCLQEFFTTICHTTTQVGGKFRSLFRKLVELLSAVFCCSWCVSRARLLWNRQDGARGGTSAGSSTSARTSAGPGMNSGDNDDSGSNLTRSSRGFSSDIEQDNGATIILTGASNNSVSATTAGLKKDRVLHVDKDIDKESGDNKSSHFSSVPTSQRQSQISVPLSPAEVDPNAATARVLNENLDQVHDFLSILSAEDGNENQGRGAQINSNRSSSARTSSSSRLVGGVETRGPQFLKPPMNVTGAANISYGQEHSSAEDNKNSPGGSLDGAGGVNKMNFLTAATRSYTSPGPPPPGGASSSFAMMTYSTSNSPAADHVNDFQLRSPSTTLQNDSYNSVTSTTSAVRSRSSTREQPLLEGNSTFLRAGATSRSGRTSAMLARPSSQQIDHHHLQNYQHPPAVAVTPVEDEADTLLPEDAVRGLLFNADDLPYHVKRIYFSGSNDWEDAWRLEQLYHGDRRIITTASSRPPAGTTYLHVDQMNKWDQFSARLNEQIFNFSARINTKFRIRLSHLIKTLYPPLLPWFKRKFKRERACRLLEFVSMEMGNSAEDELLLANLLPLIDRQSTAGGVLLGQSNNDYNAANVLPPSSSSTSNAMIPVTVKFGCDYSASLAYLDFLDYDSKTLFDWSPELKQNEQKILLASGTGDYDNPFALELSDPLVAQLQSVCGSAALLPVLHQFNRCARTIRKEEILAGFREYEMLMRSVDYVENSSGGYGGTTTQENHLAGMNVTAGGRGVAAINKKQPAGYYYRDEHGREHDLAQLLPQEVLSYVKASSATMMTRSGAANSASLSSRSRTHSKEDHVIGASNPSGAFRSTRTSAANHATPVEDLQMNNPRENMTTTSGAGATTTSQRPHLRYSQIISEDDVDGSAVARDVGVLLHEKRRTVARGRQQQHTAGPTTGRRLSSQAGAEGSAQLYDVAGQHQHEIENQTSSRRTSTMMQQHTRASHVQVPLPTVATLAAVPETVAVPNMISRGRSEEVSMRVLAAGGSSSSRNRTRTVERTRNSRQTTSTSLARSSALLTTKLREQVIFLQGSMRGDGSAALQRLYHLKHAVEQRSDGLRFGGLSVSVVCVPHDSEKKSWRVGLLFTGRSSGSASGGGSSMANNTGVTNSMTTTPNVSPSNTPRAGSCVGREEAWHFPNSSYGNLHGTTSQASSSAGALFRTDLELSGGYGPRSSSPTTFGAAGRAAQPDFFDGDHGEAAALDHHHHHHHLPIDGTHDPLAGGANVVGADHGGVNHDIPPTSCTTSRFDQCLRLLKKTAIRIKKRCQFLHYFHLLLKIPHHLILQNRTPPTNSFLQRVLILILYALIFADAMVTILLANTFFELHPLVFLTWFFVFPLTPLVCPLQGIAWLLLAREEKGRTFCHLVAASMVNVYAGFFAWAVCVVSRALSSVDVVPAVEYFLFDVGSRATSRRPLFFTVPNGPEGPRSTTLELTTEQEYNYSPYYANQLKLAAEQGGFDEPPAHQMLTTSSTTLLSEKINDAWTTTTSSITWNGVPIVPSSAGAIAYSIRLFVLGFAVFLAELLSIAILKIALGVTANVYIGALEMEELALNCNQNGFNITGSSGRGNHGGSTFAGTVNENEGTITGPFSAAPSGEEIQQGGRTHPGVVPLTLTHSRAVNVDDDSGDEHENEAGAGFVVPRYSGMA